MLEQNFSKNIHKASQAYHIQRFSASDAAASTQSNLGTSWISIALTLVKQYSICISIFDLLSSRIDIKTTSVEQEAASAVVSVDT